LETPPLIHEAWLHRRKRAGELHSVPGRNQNLSAVQGFFKANRAKDAGPVARDTIFPVPESFHLNYSPEVCAGLLRLFQTLERWEVCNHIKGYAANALIFTLHDGFGNTLRISERVAESSLKTFAKSLSAHPNLVLQNLATWTTRRISQSPRKLLAA
jgi:hypothetical protein